MKSCFARSLRLNQVPACSFTSGKASRFSSGRGANALIRTPPRTHCSDQKRPLPKRRGQHPRQARERFCKFRTLPEPSKCLPNVGFGSFATGVSPAASLVISVMPLIESGSKFRVHALTHHHHHRRQFGNIRALVERPDRVDERRRIPPRSRHPQIATEGRMDRAGNFALCCR